MAEAQHVAAPANLQPAAVQQPAAQPVQQIGFTQPPAASGNPITLANQVAGWVQQPAVQPIPAVPAVAQPAAVPATLDSAGIAALIATALGQQAPQAVQAANTDRPAWLPANVNDFDINTINDPIIKSMASILQTTGKDLDLNRVLGRALADGDASLIDYAYLHEKGGANAQQLAEISKGIVQAVSAKADAVTNEIHALVGGEANWSASTAVFNQAAPHELRVTVSRMLDSTDDAIIKAGAKIVAEFGKQSGKLTQLGAGLLQNNASAGALGGGLSKVQFQAELGKLKPDTVGFLEARESLFARRSLGKQSGL